MTICQGQPRRWMAWLTALALLTGAAIVPAASAAPREELTIGIAQRLPTLHPLRTAAVMSSFVWGFVNRSVSGFDDTWSAVCFLCTEVPTRENGRVKPVPLANGKRGMDVTYTIRPGTSWADGAPVLARDAAFTFEVARAVGVTSYASAYYAHVVAVTAVDERTFTVRFDEVNYSFATPVDFELLPEHIEGPIFRSAKDPADYLARSAYTTRPSDPGLWNGPYRVTHFDKAQIVLERNTAWQGAKPQFRRIALRPIPDGQEPGAWLLKGDVDYIAGEVVGLPVQQAVDLAGQYPDRFDLKSRATLSYEHIALNHDNPFLSDRRVRQALLLAIDRNQMARNLFHDTAPVADTLVSPGEPGYDPNVKRYGFDQARARQLLAEVGFKPGGDGVLVDPTNRRLSLELIVPSGNPERMRMSDWIKQAWAAIGIETRVNVQPADKVFGNLLPRGQFDTCVFASNFIPEFPPSAYLASWAIPTQQNGFSGLNWDRTNNRDIDETVNTLTAELDRARRLPQWRKLQSLYAEELPALPLFMHEGVYLVPQWLGGITPTGHRTATSYWVERWHAE